MEGRVFSAFDNGLFAEENDKLKSLLFSHGEIFRLFSDFLQPNA